MPSSDPEARVVPVGRKRLLERILLCPSRVTTSVFVAISHSLICPDPAEARTVPSGENDYRVDPTRMPLIE